MKKKICFATSGLHYEFDETGNLSQIVSSCSDLINSMIPGAADGEIGEIVLRIYRRGTSESYPLTGRDAVYSLSSCPEGLCFRSNCGTVTAEVCFLPGPEGWVWNVNLQGSCEAFDLLYMQDLGLAEIPAQRANELYTAQYLAHHAQDGSNGVVIVSRQNLPQGGRHPCIWQGMLSGKAISYDTDGTRYFGNTYRTSRIPEARGGNLSGKIIQGESACIALQTERAPMNGCWNGSFYALYQADHPDVIAKDELPDTSKLDMLLLSLKNVQQAPEIHFAHRRIIPTLCSPEMTEDEVVSLYPKRELEEKDEQGRLLSFFTEDHCHIVLQRKELLCERPHGIILTTLFDTEKLPDNLLTSTAYMYGNFACQTVVGNTSLHKLSSVSRGLYDWLPFSGTRICIRIGGTWKMLGIPALFEMGFHSARWIYLLPEDELEVRIWMSAECPGMKLEVQSAKGRAYDYLLTMQTVMSEHEFNQPCDITSQGQNVILRMSREAGCLYPDLFYSLTSDCPWKMYRDEAFFEDGATHDDSLLTFSICARKHFSVEFHGDIYGSSHPAVRSCAIEQEAYQKAYRDFLGEFSLYIPQDAVVSQRINHTAYWFLHNAMVHFCVPHGLEQTGGAAWGTRDVCQGPFELFLATGHNTLARAILVRVFENQKTNGDWPQWFMFDRYAKIHAGDSHGDIVLWPLKALGDYLSRTGDQALLLEPIHPTLGGEEHLLQELVLRSIRLIESRFIGESNLLQYGNGDWDDTLQPANPELRSRMSSAWTQALAYQTLKLFTADTLPSQIAEPCARIASRLQKGFESMAENGFIPGFCSADNSGIIRSMITPMDEETKIHYRLIPYTRAILSGLANAESSESYLEIIRKHLLAPDGAHLLDRPTHYSGGNSSVFLRAEQAANIGREISLQYVHAHIRYTYALAKCGKASQAWEALLQVAPPMLSASVPNALPRQSNVYFTSSDANISNRSEFEKRYEEVLHGDVSVKGGWRLYSSGPGIWLSLLLDSIFAVHKNNPVIPDEYNGLLVTLHENGMDRIFRYDAEKKQYTLLPQNER